jgi:uncharacterized phage protein (predicted DNA packaging)
MSIVDLDEAKLHCRVTNDLEDDLLVMHIESAEDWIGRYLNRDPIPVRPVVKSAALLIIEDLYRNRGAKLEMKQYNNPAVESLLHPLRDDLGF